MCLSHFSQLLQKFYHWKGDWPLCYIPTQCWDFPNIFEFSKTIQQCVKSFLYEIRFCQIKPLQNQKHYDQNFRSKMGLSIKYVRKIFRKINVSTPWYVIERIWGLEMLVFWKILRTHLMDDPSLPREESTRKSIIINYH